MIRGCLTGNVRFRRSLFGRLILQVEYQWSGMAAGSHNVRDHVSWRDADYVDLLNPKLRRLMRRRPASANRRRAAA